MITIDGYEDFAEAAVKNNRTVYIASHSQSGRMVRVHLFRGEAATRNDRALDTLNRIKSQVPTSQHTVRCTDVFSAGSAKEKEIVVITDQLSGICLRDFMAARRPTIAEFLKIADDMAGIVGKLHQNGIVLGQLSPGAFYIDPENLQVQLDWIDALSIEIIAELPAGRYDMTDRDTVCNILPYMSPEGTGRTNTKTDYRSDYYALGAVFYELLTHKQMFASQDPLEVIHAHIARPPLPPAELRPEIPVSISNIVLKLVSKSPNERYQSLYGLQFDFSKCRNYEKDPNALKHFVIGSRDVPEHFRLHHKLYGRTDQLKRLQTCFSTVKTGAFKFLMISGPPGIGKSRLIQELQKPVMTSGGYCISGKYDPFQQNIPYSAIIQAFREFIRQILAEDPERVEKWKHALTEAVGANGYIIAEVIPEVELIIGEQVPQPDLPATEAQNRFHTVCERFFNIFSRKGRPLVIFLDDVHWADPASIKLFDRLLNTIFLRYCFIICAYREEESRKKNPMITLFEKSEAFGAAVETMRLESLEARNIKAFLIDSFSQHIAEVDALAAAIFRRTSGNPLFIKQFLQSLHRNNALTYDYENGVWEWSRAALESNQITDSVIDLMIEKIQRLPLETQNLLKLAACMGDRFDARVLAVVNQASAEETTACLAPAMADGLLLRHNDTEPDVWPHSFDETHADGRVDTSVIGIKNGIWYEFFHDKVRQTVYDLVPISDRRTTHYKIGRFMLKHCDPQAFDTYIYNIVNHLNHGIDFSTAPEKRNELASLNLAAGKKAKNATAYSLALSYLNTGISLLVDNCWKEAYTLAFSLHKEKMECEYLNHDLDTAEQMFDLLICHACGSFDIASIHNLKMIMFASLARHDEAVAIGRKGLGYLGLHMREPQTPVSAIRYLIQIQLQLRSKESEFLLNLPKMQGKREQLIIDMLMNLSFSAYLCNPYLIIVIASKIITLTLKHGNSAAAALGYAIYGAAVCALFENYRTGSQYGELALKIDEIYGEARSTPKVFLYVGSGISLWYQSLRTSAQFNRRAFHLALETGDRNFAVYNFQSMLMFEIASGVPLADIEKRCARYFDFVEMTKDSGARNYLISVRQTIRCLKGETADVLSLDDSRFNEQDHIERMTADGIQIIVMRHYLLKLRLFCIMGAFSQAAVIEKKCRKLLSHHIGTIVIAEFYFYGALTFCALYDSTHTMGKPKRKRTIHRYYRKINRMASACPQNFKPQASLIAAELARIGNHITQALHLYQDAIQAAQENGFRQIEALASERAAQFYRELGFSEMSDTLLQDAASAYRAWGAQAKATGILEALPSNITYNAETAAIHGGRQIDYATVMASLQAVSTEIETEKLLKKLIRTCLQNAGAQRVVFLINEKEGLYVIASGTAERDAIDICEPILMEKNHDLLVPLVHYVKRTLRYQVLDDASQLGDFMTDPYVLHTRPKSILCLPVTRMSELIAILYFENNLTRGAFTQDRIETLQLLAGQAAISFENARLYDRIRGKEKDLRILSDKLRSLSSEIVLTEERERRRIAVELHDRIGHALTNVRIQLGLLQDAEPDEQRPIKEKIDALVDESIQDVHSLTFDLSPPVLYDLGLEAALEWLAYQTQDQHGIDVDFKDDNRPKPVDESIRVLVFQAVRELLFNIVKHAHANKATIAVKQVKPYIQIDIIDNGIGMPTLNPSTGTKKTGGFGLFSIQERLKLQGGKIDIVSEPGQGTKISLFSPMNSREGGVS